MGDDVAKGEVRQLLVEGGWWKVSEIPESDRAAAESGEADAARTGALISEIVTPGFHWNDHTYLNQERLRELLAVVHTQKSFSRSTKSTSRSNRAQCVDDQ